MKKQLFSKQGLNALNNSESNAARAYCGCATCSCKKASLKSDVNYARLAQKLISPNA